MVDHKSKLLNEVITLHNWLDDKLMTLTDKQAEKAYYQFSEIWKALERRTK